MRPARSTTDGCSAICARAFADSTKDSAVSVFVRARQDDQIVLTTYGRSSGFCVDPIEKKPLNHFLPGTAVLSFGTAGCNLSCKFCQNWDISKSRQVDTLADAASPDLIARAAQSLGCRSVAFTYNDRSFSSNTPWMWHRPAAREICAEPRREFYSFIDAANVDLKGFTEGFYRRVCGGHLQAVLDTLIYLKNETAVWIEITNLLIPDENDSAEEREEMTRWVVANLGPDVPMHFSAFHPDWKMLDKASTPAATLSRARAIARKNGVRHAYTGNVHDRGGSSTYCHNCSSELIGRDWYVLHDWNLNAAGECPSCGTRCPGRFEALPGTWGARRQPVRLRDFERA